MQGQGMSLSAPEKIRVVEALDPLGVHYIEAGFPDSDPKDLELFELFGLGAARAGHRLLFLHDAPPRPRRPRRSGGLAALVGCFAAGAPVVGKTWSLHLDKAIWVSRGEKPGDGSPTRSASAFGRENG